jgi:hypothetical protein
MKKTLATLIAVLVAGTPFLALADDGTSGTGSATINVSSHAGAGPGLRADVGAHVAVQGTGDVKERAKDRANEEIERRIDALTHLSGRIDDAKRIGGDDKSSLVASINAQISELTTLKAQIESDDSTTTLKADIQSITKSYRIFMLVVPQGAINAAADRVLTVAGQMESFSVKLQARIDAATDVDTNTLNGYLDDYNAKVADAKVQANAAIDLVANLKPDNGDASVAASNKTALQDARAKVVAAQKDLQDARQDAQKIAVAVKGHGEVKTGNDQ